MDDLYGIFIILAQQKGVELLALLGSGGQCLYISPPPHLSCYAVVTFYNGSLFCFMISKLQKLLQVLNVFGAEKVMGM